MTKCPHSLPSPRHFLRCFQSFSVPFNPPADFSHRNNNVCCIVWDWLSEKTNTQNCIHTNSHWGCRLTDYTYSRCCFSWIPAGFMLWILSHATCQGIVECRQICVDMSIVQNVYHFYPILSPIILNHNCNVFRILIATKTRCSNAAAKLLSCGGGGIWDVLTCLECQTEATGLILSQLSKLDWITHKSL